MDSTGGAGGSKLPAPISIPDPMERPIEILQMLLDNQIAGKGSLYFTTARIDLNTALEIINDVKTFRMSLPGFAKSLLLKKLRAEIPAPQNDQGLEDWEVDCDFFPLNAKQTLHIKNSVHIDDDGQRWEWWSLCFDEATLSALRDKNAFLCGADFTLWAYIDDDSRRLRLLGVSKHWDSDRLTALMSQLSSTRKIVDSMAGLGGEGSSGDGTNA